MRKKEYAGADHHDAEGSLTISYVSVPEPATILVLGLSLLGLG
jgi:hypothetical protein